MRWSISSVIIISSGLIRYTIKETSRCSHWCWAFNFSKYIGTLFDLKELEYYLVFLHDLDVFTKLFEPLSLKFSFSEKATKFDKNLPIFDVTKLSQNTTLESPQIVHIFYNNKLFWVWSSNSVHRNRENIFFSLFPLIFKLSIQNWIFSSPEITF